MKSENLCESGQEFEAFNTDKAVLIYRHEREDGPLVPAAPLTEIPVAEPRSDREAYLLAMAWLREHRHISTGEYSREVRKFMLHSEAHPTECAHRPIGKSAR